MLCLQCPSAGGVLMSTTFVAGQRVAAQREMVIVQDNSP